MMDRQKMADAYVQRYYLLYEPGETKTDLDVAA